MSHATIVALDHAVHTAQDWIVDVARFAAQLPDLLRGHVLRGLATVGSTAALRSR
ncbi:MAG TPA: hypothetical protein VE441_02170 [Mycobacterium sp.]|jgi:hypothetical protein|nr:hypothetical protein [Mycobacterium sp.]